MKNTNDMIHIFGAVAFINYFLFTGFQMLGALSTQLRRLSRGVLLLGILSNLTLIYQILQTDIANSEGSIFIQSHPSLLLLLVTTVIYLLVFIYEPESSFVRRAISLVTFVIFCFGAVFLHQANASKVYQLSPILIIHILVSLVSQIYLVFVFLFSIVLVFVDRNLKSRKISYTESDFPPLMPTERLWIRVITQGIGVLGLAIGTGLLQVRGFSYSNKLFFVFLGMLGLIAAFSSYKFTAIKTSTISLSIALYIPLIFVFQVLSRHQIAN